MNEVVRAIIVVPLTSTVGRYPFRVSALFGGRPGDLAIDQMRSVDKARLVRWLGPLDAQTSANLAERLVETFQL